MTIDDLLKEFTALGETIERASNSDWLRFESKHLKVPEDFERYLSILGTGILAEFFIVWNPFSNINGVNWCDEVEQSRASFLDVYPECTDLLPFGHTANGDTLFWVATGEPDTWCVAAAREKPVLYTMHSLPDFLHNALTTRWYAAKFPDLTQVARTFRPLKQ
jgi:hypothetical protein